MIWASFMPKPFTDAPRFRNAHPRVAVRGRLQRVLRGRRRVPAVYDRPHFIAGILHHASEITCVTNQWVNSYKRLIGGGEAPSYMSWGHNNRSAMVRVPMYKPNKGQSTRIELRSIDAACNPYLAFAVVLAAGMKGLEEEYELPREAEDDVWSLNARERKALRPRRSCRRPSTTRSAIAEDSELLAETLGEHVYEFFLRNKRAEWEEYRGAGLRLRAGPGRLSNCTHVT